MYDKCVTMSQVFAEIIDVHIVNYDANETAWQVILTQWTEWLKNTKKQKDELSKIWTDHWPAKIWENI